jgi:uncharacterized membrane protein YoaK (UPF0700 family)
MNIKFYVSMLWADILFCLINSVNAIAFIILAVCPTQLTTRNSQLGTRTSKLITWETLAVVSAALLRLCGRAIVNRMPNQRTVSAIMLFETCFAYLVWS